MKAFIKALLCCSLIASLLLTGCGGGGTGDDTTTPADTDPVETPAVDPAKHNITLSDIRSVLAQNELGTNINKFSAFGSASHGGQQMRVCHTERGAYVAFAKDIGEREDFLRYYVAKVGNDSQASVLYYGELDGGGDGTVSVDIGQDTNGDIIVTATSHKEHTVHIFDSETDAVASYEIIPTFSTDNMPECSQIGYSNAMFDFNNRKLYAFSICGSGTTVETVGDSLIEWYIFDLDKREWSEESVHVWTEDIGRHAYLYSFPDGKGGAYIAALRNEYAEYAAGRFSLAEADGLYIWDRMGLFHIPDLSTGENTEYVVVQEEDDSLGLEGIWSHAHPNQYGDVFVDSDGYMHITYRFYLWDYTGQHEPYDDKLQYRHAVYKGMECIFNEKLEVPDEDHMYYRPMVRQSTDGKLHLILATYSVGGKSVIEFDFYSAGEELGKTWKHEKNIKLEEGLSTESLSLSSVRDGSVQDNILSGFFYGYNTKLDKTAYTFKLSLEDYSVTELVNILEDYDIQLDWWYDKRMPYADHQTSVVHTENGSYAAFVYNYNHEDGQEYYHIVKIDNDKKITVLHSDSFKSEQNKSLTMSLGEDGTVYVVPPEGRHAYFIDTATDEVTLHELTAILTNKLLPRQMSIVSIPGTGDNYCISALAEGTAGFNGYLLDPEEMTFKMKNAISYEADRELIGTYDGIYTLSDGKNGVYMVSTRNVNGKDLDGKLEYNGYLDNIDDSIMLFYISDVSDATSMQCIDVEAPYEAEGAEGIWSIAKINDVYLDSTGKLNVIYASYHFDLDDKDRAGNPELIADTLKHYHAVYENGELLSRDELKIDGLTRNDSIRIAETKDGTLYLVTCNLQRDFENLGYSILRYCNGRYPEGGEAYVSVYCETEDGWKLAVKKDLGQLAADGFFIGDSQNSDSVDCLIYASDNDVYHLNISFEAKN